MPDVSWRGVFFLNGEHTSVSLLATCCSPCTLQQDSHLGTPSRGQIILNSRLQLVFYNDLILPGKHELSQHFQHTPSCEDALRISLHK